MKFLTPQVRTYLYGVSSAAMPLLVTLGVFTNDLAKDVLFLVAALLGVGSNLLAAANVTPKPPVSGPTVG
jgi:hypothetical protein